MCVIVIYSLAHLITLNYQFKTDGAGWDITRRKGKMKKFQTGRFIGILLAVLAIFIISAGTCSAQCYGIRGKNNGRIWFKGTKSQCEAEWKKNCTPAPFHRQGAGFGVPEEEERKLHDELERKRIEQFKATNEIIKISDEECVRTSSVKTNRETLDMALWRRISEAEDKL